MSAVVTFENALEALSFKDHREFYFLNELDNVADNSIKFLLEEASSYKPTAIYIAKLQNQFPQPQIYIYDNTNNHLKDKDISKLHKELWSSAKVPLFFVFGKTEIKIFNSRKSPENIENLSTLEIINLASNAQKEIEKRKLFNVEMFDSGVFWEQDKYKNEFKFENSVYNVLLNDLENLRDELVASNNISKQTIESLLIKSILVKYLDERGVFNQEDNNFWTQFGNKSKFSELFDDNKLVIQLFDSLKEHFNGGVFDISDEKEDIKKISLTSFKDFLEADTETTKNNNKQKLLWAKYSFKDLPIELISNIYELFLKSDNVDNNGIVYTPPILVDFMINEIMPLDKPQENYKLIDPACGSGIFLVGAYKRLIQWWRIQNNFQKPTIKEAQKIITGSIFGIDKEEGAIEVAYFSLSLALCDTFLPQEIWSDLKFEDLREKNLLAKDFFEFIVDKNYKSLHMSYDLVIGNPPFVSQKKKWTKVAKDIDKDESVPDAQLSFLFLKHSLKLLKKDAYLVMIQPSAFLYNHGAYEFRNKIFEEYKCHQVIDFACLKTLFKKSKKASKGPDVAVSVFFLQNAKPNTEDDSLLHVTVRQTLLAREKIYFDLSHYDFHWLKYKDALKQKSIWKCDLMGGSRVRDIVSKMEDIPSSLGDFLEDKKNQDIENRWYTGDGYQEGNETKKTNIAPWITGKNLVPPEAFSSTGIDNNKLVIVKDEKFQWTREPNKKIFSPPHLLIKKQLDNNHILCEYRDDYLVFKNTIYGIYAPRKDKYKLMNIERYLKNNGKILLFYLATTSPRALIYKATSLLQKDINLLPFYDGIDDLKLSKIEQYFVDDTLDFMVDFCKDNKDSPLLKYANNKQIKEYCEIYDNVLKGIYENIKLLDSHATNLYQIVAFYFGEKPSNTLFDDKKNITNDTLATLVKNKKYSLHISKIVRIYEDNVIYIIKPRQYRFWLKSIAVRDADETFADLLEMGY